MQVKTEIITQLNPPLPIQLRVFYFKTIRVIRYFKAFILYVQEVLTQPKILNRTILYNLGHVT